MCRALYLDLCERKGVGEGGLIAPRDLAKAVKEMGLNKNDIADVLMSYETAQHLAVQEFLDLMSEAFKRSGGVGGLAAMPATLSAVNEDADVRERELDSVTYLVMGYSDGLFM